MATILVVDDLLVDRRLAGGLLSQDESISVEYATNGREGIEQIEAHLPDLVLTDLQMPEMDGLEFVKAIKENYPLIPAILMTARGSEEIATQAIEHGAASYVPKKHLASELLETVHRVLAAAKEERNQTRLSNRVAETTFVLENDLALLSSVVIFVRQTIQQRKICNESDMLRLGTAVDEALLNAYYHGNLEVSSKLKEEDHNEFHRLANQRLQETPYCDRRITVTAKFLPSEASVTIRDEGPGFNPSDLPDPTDPEFLERPSGRGLLLMRAFMDEITFNETGNQVTLVKRKTEEVEEVPVGAASN